MNLYNRNLGYSEVGTSDSIINFEEPELEININNNYRVEAEPLIPQTPNTNSQFTYDEEAHDIPLDHFNILKLYHPRYLPIRVYQRIPNNTPCPNSFKSITNFAGVSETNENYWRHLDKMLGPFKHTSLDVIMVKYDNSDYNIDFMIAQEEQLFKLASPSQYLESGLDLTLLPYILNKDIQASLPSKNPSIAPMFSDAGSQLHFNNHVKLAEYSRLHDKYWRTYLKLVDLIPTDKHQYSHHKVKNILKASVFSDSRFSNSYKKLFIEFMISYETLERKLFHWLSPSYEGLLSLYGNFNRSEYGIAIAVNDHYSIMGSNVILSIREVHKSDIPIHVYYNGDSDLNPLNQNMLRSLALNVELHDLSTIVDNNFVQIEGFATKVFAQLLTPARHVMLLDADAVLLQSPEHAFKHPGYESKGTLFFLDRQFLPVPPETVEWFLSLLPDKFSNNEVPARLAKLGWFTGESEHIQESGMVIIDKVKHFTPLLTSSLLNKKVERGVTYKRVHEDKETFWIGFEIIGHPYYFSPYEPRPIGGESQPRGEGMFEMNADGKAVYENSDPNEYCACHMLHFDHEAKPLWINGGLWYRKDRPDEDGLALYTEYVSASSPSKWQYKNDAFYMCLKALDDEHDPLAIKALEPEVLSVLSQITILYTNFYNNPVINPSKNL